MEINYKLMSTKEVAQWLNIEEKTLYDYARRNLIPHVRIGRQIRFKQSDVDAFINKGGQGFQNGWRR